MRHLSDYYICVIRGMWPGMSGPGGGCLHISLGEKLCRVAIAIDLVWPRYFMFVLLFAARGDT